MVNETVLKNELSKKTLLANLRDLIQKLENMDSMAFAKKDHATIKQVRYLENEAILMSATITAKEKIDTIDTWAVVGLQSEVIHVLSHFEQHLKPPIEIMIMPVGGMAKPKREGLAN